MTETKAKTEVFILDTFLGRLKVSVHEGKVVKLHYLSGTSAKERNTSHQLSATTRAVKQQLQTYFSTTAPANQTKKINVEFTEGTVYQQTVWRELLKITAGNTITYGQLAKKLGSGPRAVANACRNNPIPVIVPCHRVVAKAGLGGYHGATSGKYLNIKKKLLAHEGAIISVQSKLNGG